jgi:hypothetical protein
LVGNDIYITPNPGDGTIEGYASLVGAFSGFLPRQNEVLETRGGQYQLNLSWGGNYDDRFYFGGGIGVQTVDYTQRRTFLENQYADENGNPDDLIEFIEITDRLDIEGTGINATLGVIARPVNFMTLGVSYVTPTYYNLNEESDFTFSNQWNPNIFYVAGPDTVDLGFISTTSDIQISDYNLRTPSRLNLGTAFFIGKYGFITGDVEFVDYSAAQLKSNDFIVTEDNDVIRDIYRNVVNYRLGAEVRLDAFRLRGGFSHQSDPYKDSTFDRSTQFYTFGGGYRNENYFFDLALVNSFQNSFYNPYTLPEDSPIAETETRITRAVVTVGFVF